MAKIHHNVPIGMMAVSDVLIDQTSTPSQFQQTLADIYKGDEISPYQGCNFIQSYGDPNGWGAGPPEPNPGRVERNAQMWINYLDLMDKANTQVGGGNLKGIIGRNLAALRAGTPNTYLWDKTEIEEFARRVCQKLKETQYQHLQNRVAGWYLSDEGLSRTWHWYVPQPPDPQNPPHWIPDSYAVTDCYIRDATDAVHKAQVTEGFNWPFYWAEPVAVQRDQPSHEPPYPVYPHNWWITENSRWVHRVPTTFKTWVDILFELDHASYVTQESQKPVLVFMPFHFAWGSATVDWRYRKHATNPPDTQPPNRVLNEILPDNPLWMNWNTFMNTLQSDALNGFPKASYPRLRFQPVLETSKQGQLFPRHVDLHKSIRVLLNLRQRWLRPDFNDTRFEGLWFMGWKQTAGGNAAWNNWTTGLRYAEAVQNEPEAGTEALTGVWQQGDPPVNIISRLISVDPDPKDSAQQGRRIQYHLAPSTLMSQTNPLLLGAFSLGQRPRVQIAITRRFEDGSEQAYHVIDEGYLFPDTCTNASPHGKYDGRTDDQGIELQGTAAYWDGRGDEHGPSNYDGVNVPHGNYRVYLFVDGGIADYRDFAV